MLSAAALGSIHENHEVPFMMSALVRGTRLRDHSSRGGSALAAAVRRCEPDLRRHRMTWETPTAIDWRFGFEISLYVANR
jgi:coenzyme PQQ precursor peptide PqqA